jgi:UDP-N-acetylglucosamine transferase subunit ALG13
MIFVTTGTHHQPFDRLVAAAEALARRGERVVVQAGASGVPTPSCERYAWLAPDVVARLADEAEVIVTHTGPGSLFLAWDRGRRPIVVPRRPERGEHVDDHQVRFAEHLRASDDRVIIVDDPARLAEDWPSLAAQARRPLTAGTDARSVAFGEALEREIDALLVRTSRPNARPAGLRASLSWLLTCWRDRP